MAGPGTGKTYCLMRRAGRLLQEGADPERILVCTFTRTAARDLRVELARLGLPEAQRVRAGTLHSLCFSMLSESSVLELTDRVPRPLLSFEERFLIEDLKAEGLGGLRDARKRLKAFNAAWARDQSDDPGWPQDERDRQYHLALLSWLRFHNAMLIGELVPEALRYLRNNPLSPYRSAFDHVLVDEYQDLNRAEQVLLDFLAETGTLAVVGDEDQSIYSFKFAHPEGIAQFADLHPGTQDEGLDECRRCPSWVVEMASDLIRQNRTRSDRGLRSAQQAERGRVYTVQWQTLEAEARGIARFVQQELASGRVRPGQVLVLAPRRQLGYAVRDELHSLGVPSHSFFHEEALEDDPREAHGNHALRAFTLLTLLADPEDRVALRCWCGLGSPSLRAGAWLRLRTYCEDAGSSPLEALSRMAERALSVPGTADLVPQYEELVRAVEEKRDLQGRELASALFPDNDWGQALRSLAAGIEGGFSAQVLREALRTAIAQPELPTDVDYVRVMSLHKSKGLSADLVIVLGCVEGLIPSYSGDTSTERQRSLEEQRRLFYVAVTRTRDTLVLSGSITLPRSLAHRMGALVREGTPTDAFAVASRFLHELGGSAPRVVPGNRLLA